MEFILGIPVIALFLFIAVKLFVKKELSDSDSIIQHQWFDENREGKALKYSEKYKSLIQNINLELKFGQTYKINQSALNKLEMVDNTTVDFQNPNETKIYCWDARKSVFVQQNKKAKKFVSQKETWRELVKKSMESVEEGNFFYIEIPSDVTNENEFINFLTEMNLSPIRENGKIKCLCA